MSLPENYQPNPDLLRGKVILVTGAGDGIGKTAAKTYANFGATILLLGRTVSKLEQIYDEIIEQDLAEPGIISADMGTLGMNTLEEIAKVITSRYGRLDGLLHNAAILGERIPIEQYDLADWDNVMNINFNGVVLLTRFLLPCLQQSDAASLVFTSSTVGKTPRAYWGPYSVSKHAVEGFALLLADELENTSNIRVNILNPGATRTSMRASAYPNEDPLTLKTPEDLMPLYVYVMSEDSLENGKTFMG